MGSVSAPGGSSRIRSTERRTPSQPRFGGVLPPPSPHPLRARLDLDVPPQKNPVQQNRPGLLAFPGRHHSVALQVGGRSTHGHLAAIDEAAAGARAGKAGHAVCVCQSVRWHCRSRRGRSRPTVPYSRARDYRRRPRSVNGCVYLIGWVLGGGHPGLRPRRRLGVEADLHVWEGLGHATFAFNPRLPESDDVHEVIARFFDEHLSRRSRRSRGSSVSP